LGYHQYSFLLPDDKEESALTINGKKSNLKKVDFDRLAENLELNYAQRDSVYKQLFKVRKDFNETIENSLLTKELKEGYHAIINSNYKILAS
jgi:serine/threonine-protein kinase HipA